MKWNHSLSIAVLTLSAAAMAGTGACSSSDDTTPAATIDAGAVDTGTSDAAEADAAPLTGAELVAANHCTSCHGADLSGADSPLQDTEQYPANITQDKDTGIGDWTDAQITSALKTGIDDQGEQLCPKMPHFGETLSDAQIALIVGYLRTVPAVSHATPESVCPPIKNGNTDAGEDASSADASSDATTD